jgi:hypothetical protein
MLTPHPDLAGWSREFALRACKSMESKLVSLELVSELTGISMERLRDLMGCEEIFHVSELQLLGIILGIGVDKIFLLPTDLSRDDIHQIFLELRKQNVGLLAATDGEETQPISVDQDAFERSVVHLNYCAECLACFPP